MGELLAPGRIAGTATRLVVQTFLVVVLWRALYAGVESSAGLDRDQAVTYAVLAVLCLQMRGLYRAIAWDSVFQHVQEGSIVYWFLRPVTPRRYYLIRAAGDLAYGFVWVAAGCGICLATGLVSPPPSAAAAVAAAVSLLFGQITLYYLMLVVDLLCFWTIKNGSAIEILGFAQNLLSGALAPLWYFPGWFIALSAVMPFQGTMHVPLSLYIGRIPVERAPVEVAVQASWCLALAVVTGVMWRRVAKRLTVQGG